ncbi:DUF397 domain-containing protein [Actinomadura sp. 21ATH]|uniref:DUF397 domain-containing protein n=1 Tax=Actinomadura sp. 21ATH TaxID=1735444 RepID=UPI0035BEC57D
MESRRLSWRKSSRSNESGDNCVEVAADLEFVVLRDSQDPTGPTISMRRHAFRHLAEWLKKVEPFA